MELYLPITDNLISLEQSLAKFHEVGLNAVQVKGEGRLKIIGGSQIKRGEFGYEISEPVFSIFFNNSHWIATIQDMNAFQDVNISQTLTSLEKAVEFICNVYAATGLAKASRKPNCQE